MKSSTQARSSGEMGAEPVIAENWRPPRRLVALLGHDLGLDVAAIGVVGRGARVRLALHFLEQHFPDPGDEVDLGRAHQREVVEQRREVALGGEVGGAADAERGVEDDAAHDVADGHEVQRDGGQLAVDVPLGAEPAAPAVGHEAVGVHRALGGAGAARGVDQQSQGVGVTASGLGSAGVRGAVGDDVVEGLDGDGLVGQPRGGGLECLAVVVDLRVVVEDHQALRRVRGEGEFDGVVEVIDAGEDRDGLGLDEDRVQRGDGRAGLQRDRDGSDEGQCHVDDGVVGAGEAEGGDAVAGLDGVAGQGVGESADPRPRSRA